MEKDVETRCLFAAMAEPWASYGLYQIHGLFIKSNSLTAI